MSELKYSAKKYYLFLRSYLFSRCTYLIFFVTSECNARCRICFYWQEIEHAKEKNELSLEEIKLIAKNFKYLGYLSITGGEPILREGLDEIIYYFYRYSGTAFVNLTTNGLLPKRTYELTASVLKKCPGANLKINVSLDHIGQKHDEIRGAKGSFDNALDTFERLRHLKQGNSNLFLLITTVLSSYNADAIFDIIDYVKCNIRPDAHSIALIRGNSRERSAKGVSDVQYKKVIGYLSSSAGADRAGVMQKLLELMMCTNLKILTSDKMILPCVAGRKMLTLTDDGLIIPCEMINGIFPDKNFVIGDLRKNNYNINDILDSKSAHEISEFINRSKCHCTFECATLWSSIFNLKMYPKILMQMIK